MLFDAIEFSDVIASGDVLYDLAFLLMDLIERGLRPAANIVLNRYLAETRRAEDLDALATLPFFLSMRAAIRAKVDGRAAGPAPTAEQAPPSRSAARDIFRLCARASIAPPRAAPGRRRRPFRHRQIGAGARAGARLGAAPGAVVLRSDVERKALFGKDESEKLPARRLRADVTARVYATLADKARRVARRRPFAPSSTRCLPSRRSGCVMEQSARALGVPFHGLFLEADLATRMARVGARERDASDADAAVARSQESYDLGALDWARVDASGTPEETLARARTAIERSARSADTPTG